MKIPGFSKIAVASGALAWNRIVGTDRSSLALARTSSMSATSSGHQWRRSRPSGTRCGSGGSRRRSTNSAKSSSTTSSPDTRSTSRKSRYRSRCRARGPVNELHAHPHHLRLADGDECSVAARTTKRDVMIEREKLHHGSRASIYRSTTRSSIASGRAPFSSITSWNSRRSKASPRSRSARSRSSQILSSPSL